MCSSDLDAEIAAVDSGAQRLKAARTGADTLTALAALQDTETAQAAATAVGVSVERYRTIAGSLGEAARATLPPESELPPDVLTPQMREEYKKGQEAALARVAPMVPAPVLDALRPRAAELRKKELQLVGSRLKAASGQ